MKTVYCWSPRWQRLFKLFRRSRKIEWTYVRIEDHMVQAYCINDKYTFLDMRSLKKISG